MATPGFKPTSPFSAALTLVQWTQTHGREPGWEDCKPPKPGLLSIMTYYRHLPGSTFSAVVSAAFDLVSSFGSYHGAGAGTGTKMRTCLGHGCGARFPFQGAHIGFCSACRKKRTQIQDEWYEEQGLDGPRVRQLGIERIPLSDLMDL